MILHGYFRSAASYRVRIALNLKNVPHQHRYHHLRKGEQRLPDYLAMNPQGFVPALELDDGRIITQSLAIIEWLDETFPIPALLPADAYLKARVRAFALALAADTHPLQNLKVLAKIRQMAGEPAGQDWAASVNADGLAACEKLVADTTTRFAFGDQPSLADICLVPQLANARRFGVDVSAFPRLLAIEAEALKLTAFSNAAPQNQPDFEPA